MKNARLTALALLTAALMAGGALAEGVRVEGDVQPGRVLTLCAPYSGRVEDFTVEAGDAMAAGDVLFAIGTQAVYAAFDGTVTGLFAQAGDSAEDVQARYGALLYIERDEPFRAECAASESSGENERRMAHIGETVYLRSKDDRDRVGEARVIAATGRNFTIEVTRSEGLRLNETVEVFRTHTHTYTDRIATSRLQRVDPVGVSAEGHVLGVHVADGQRVRRGDLLLTVVPDALEGMQGGDGTVTMPQDGIVLSVSAESGAQVEQDAPLATYCLAEEMEIVCPVDEDELSAFAVDALVRVTLDADAERQLTGRVVKIAGASDENGEFDVTIAPDDTDGLRIGLRATVEPMDAGE